MSAKATATTERPPIPKFRDDELGYEDKASIFSKTFLLYLNPIFKIGNERVLEHVDLGATSRVDKCAHLQPRFHRFLAEERARPAKKQSLWRVLWRTCGYDQLAIAMMLYVASAAIAYGPIIILNNLVKHFEKTITLSVEILW
jgi:hypothetical protein